MKWETLQEALYDVCVCGWVRGQLQDKAATLKLKKKVCKSARVTSQTKTQKLKFYIIRVHEVKNFCLPVRSQRAASSLHPRQTELSFHCPRVRSESYARCVRMLSRLHKRGSRPEGVGEKTSRKVVLRRPKHVNCIERRQSSNCFLCMPEAPSSASLVDLCLSVF